MLVLTSAPYGLPDGRQEGVNVLMHVPCFAHSCYIAHELKQRRKSIDTDLPKLFVIVVDINPILKVFKNNPVDSAEWNYRIHVAQSVGPAIIG